MSAQRDEHSGHFLMIAEKNPLANGTLLGYTNPQISVRDLGIINRPKKIRQRNFFGQLATAGLLLTDATFAQ